ncbi:ankyrin repeat domain-containing protein [Pseudactinotalea sp.]|uniref:ankyrin repeat domain-containing protein n=1 Tax=Pseudactinotalea sp. TaxID=1926260 RepID=UPI003B3BDCA9
MASTLPENPSIDRLRRQSRELQHALDRPATPARRSEAVADVRRHHPRPDIALAAVPQGGAGSFALHDAQLTVARRYGFSGWPALVDYLQLAAPLTVDPAAVELDRLSPTDRFCALASLGYHRDDAPPRWQQAAELLTAEMLADSIWAACAAADLGAVRDHLRRSPALARTDGGPFGWAPLVQLCYSRLHVGVPRRPDAAAVAAALLDAGADPNAGYLWCGLSTPFTALTGVFGGGEQGIRRQPPHPDEAPLAELLLRRGAHPVDQQALYNRMFVPDDSHLRTLFAHGLADAGPGPWEVRLGEAIPTRAQMWRQQVDWAASHGFTDRLALLAEHGIDVTGVTVADAAAIPEDPNETDDRGITALHEAAWAGDLDRVRALLAAGADPTRRDHVHGTTPLGWAEHAFQDEAAALLRERE